MRSFLRVGIAIAPVAITVVVVGCKPATKPCMPTGMTSVLLKSASVVRLDVYGTGAHCRGSTLAPGAPPPTQSQTASAGRPLTVDVPAGHHVLLLSAFRDDAMTELLGSACTETDVRADQPLCFDLTLTEAPDSSVAPLLADMAEGPPDLTPPIDLAQRIACNPAPDNCPAGEYCASSGSCTPGCKVDLDCAGTPATPRCLVAAHQCVACLVNGDCAPGKLCSPSNTCVVGCDPKAPACPSQQMCCTSLCIDTTSDASNCGMCGRACTLPEATAQCVSSQCAVKACKSGFSDCNGAALDGCECADLGDVHHGCCPSGPNANKCEATRSDGVGDNFVDCYPKGVYNIDVATDAAHAYNPSGTAQSGTCKRGTTNESVVCMAKGNDCICFTYADDGGGAFVGRARKTTKPDACTCAIGDAGDIQWN